MILPAQTIRQLGIITPFFERTTEFGMTFGLGPAGYDVRIVEDIELVRGEFKLASTIEHFTMPNDILANVMDKSSWARRGLFVQNTVIEPGWRGHLTLELTHHGPRVKFYKGTPIAQIVFHRLEAPTDSPYNGKYQDQPEGAHPWRKE